jgi:hypothetical protein
MLSVFRFASDQRSALWFAPGMDPAVSVCRAPEVPGLSGAVGWAICPPPSDQKRSPGRIRGQPMGSCRGFGEGGQASKAQHMKPRDRPTAGWRTDLRSARFIPAKFEKPSTGAPTSPNRQPGGRSGDRAAACGLDSALARRTKLTLEAGQRHRLDRYLLKLAPLEGFHISGREFEPFAVCALPSEATMPVGLDSGWIIRSYCVNKFDLLRQSDTDLPHSFFEFVTSADFVMTARLKKVNPSLVI